MGPEHFMPLTELLSGLMCLFLFGVIARFSYKKHNFVTAASLLPLVVEAFYYFALWFDWEPFDSSEAIRVFTIRPSQIVFFFLMAVFFANGTVNEFLGKVHAHLMRALSQLRR